MLSWIGLFLSKSKDEQANGTPAGRDLTMRVPSLTWLGREAAVDPTFLRIKNKIPAGRPERNLKISGLKIRYYFRVPRPAQLAAASCAGRGTNKARERRFWRG